MPTMLRRMPTPARTIGAASNLMACDGASRLIAAETPSAAVARIDPQ